MRKFFRFKELIAIVVAISSSLFFFDFNRLAPFNIKDNVVIYAAAFNIFALFGGIMIFSTFSQEYYLIKRQNGEYNNQGLKDISFLSNFLRISVKTATYFVERTTAIVGQLVTNFSLFLWPLIIFYAITILKEKMHITMHAGFSECHSYGEFYENYGDAKMFWFIVLSALANIFNFISAIGLCVCFSILYQKTLDADNKSTLHMGLYYFLLTFYIVAYVLLIGTGLNDYITLNNSIILLDLFCSVFNGVAMILFFNRLVQILYFYQKPLKEKLVDKFYFYIATVIFPIYACAQGFFVTFDQLGLFYSGIVKSSVFFICFIGKLFLIFFLYAFVKTRWIHTAILTLLVYENTPMEIGKNLGGVSDSIDSLE